jgi:hypothetical protein
MMRNFVMTVLLVLSPSLFAAEVVKVKGKGVLIELRGDPAVTGDNFYVIAPDGKRKGIIKISKVKGEKAIGKLTKGKAAPGYTLEFKTAKSVGKVANSGGGARMSAPNPDDSAAGLTRSYWGALFGFAKDTMTVQVTNSANQNLGTAEMSGYGFSGKGLFDYELFSQIWFRGTAGLETFNAESASPAKCGPANNAACTAKLMYLTFDFIGRYVFGQGNIRPWVGGGLGLLFPASKDATALDPASISTTNVIIFAGGVDWFTSPTFYVPISLEYGMLPKSDEVEASWITVRGGFAVPF